MGALPDKAMVPALIEPLPILVKKASYILLQGVPSNISIPKVRSEIEELRHVKSVDNVSFLRSVCLMDHSSRGTVFAASRMAALGTGRGSVLARARGPEDRSE